MRMLLQFLPINRIYSNRPNFVKDQYIISALDSKDNDSAHEDDFECVMDQTHNSWLIIKDVSITHTFSHMILIACDKM